MMIALSALSVLMASCSRQNKEAENVVKVKTMRVSSTSPDNVELYSGTIEENSGISLSFPVGGTVKQISITEGQNIGAGSLVAVLDGTTSGNLLAASTATVGQARAALAQAEKSAAQALDAYNRMKQLHDNGSLPDIRWVEVQTQYRQAQDAVGQARAAVESAKAQKEISLKNLRDTRLYAPATGYISKKLTEAGQNIAPGQPVAMLVDIRRVKVRINVPEDDLSHIRLGQTLRFRVSASGNKTFAARVTEKGVVADPVTRSYEVKAVADNSGRELLPGMVCDVWTEQAAPQTVISLPANIVQIDFNNRPFVWTVVGGTARKTPVTLGELAKRGIEQSEENLRLNHDYYRAGTVTMNDLLDAQQQYQQCRDRYTDAYAALQTKILEYRQSVGQ